MPVPPVDYLVPNPVSTVVVEIARNKEYQTPEQIASYVSLKALETGTEPELALSVGEGESGFIATTTGDLKIVCPAGPHKGEPVYARGPWQITRCYHPEVTDAQAFDIKFSTEWAMPKLKDKKTCMKEWTQCRLYYTSKNL